jgi:hypothetical protein
MNQLTDAILKAKSDFISTHEPTNKIEINSGYCRWFLNYLDDNYELPDSVERIDAFDVHSWLYYNGKHYDVEHPNGISNPHNLSVWKRLTYRRLELAAQNTNYLDKKEFKNI